MDYNAIAMFLYYNRMVSPFQNLNKDMNLQWISCKICFSTFRPKYSPWLKVTEWMHHAKTNYFWHFCLLPLWIFLDWLGMFLVSFQRGTTSIEQGTNNLQQKLSRHWPAEMTVHDATYDGDTEAIWLLIETGASVNATDKYQRTPLHLSVREGHMAAIQQLIK